MLGARAARLRKAARRLEADKRAEAKALAVRFRALAQTMEGVDLDDGGALASVLVKSMEVGGTGRKRSKKAVTFADDTSGD